MEHFCPFFLIYLISLKLVLFKHFFYFFLPILLLIDIVLIHDETMILCKQIDKMFYIFSQKRTLKSSDDMMELIKNMQSK